jgi:hypothetical protein
MNEPERIMSCQRVPRCSHTTAAPPGISQTITFRSNFANFAMTKAYSFDGIMSQDFWSRMRPSPGVSALPEGRKPVDEKTTYQALGVKRLESQFCA